MQNKSVLKLDLISLDKKLKKNKINFIKSVTNKKKQSHL